MPSYRPPISREQFKNLEFYYFRLVMFTNSSEFKDLSSLNILKISNEIVYIGMTLDILSNLFSVKEGNERAVVAWKQELDDDETHQIIYRFSSATVAGKVLNCIPSKIGRVCNGIRKSTGGNWVFNPKTGKKEWKNAYIFQFEDVYDEQENLTFNPNNTKFEFYGKNKSTIKTNGNI